MKSTQDYSKTISDYNLQINREASGGAKSSLERLEEGDEALEEESLLIEKWQVSNNLKTE